MTLDEINRLRALKSTNDGIAFDLEVLKVADELLDAAQRAERAEKANAVLLSSIAEFMREYENAFPAHATLSIGGTGHPIGSGVNCEACRLYPFYDKACIATDAAGALKGVG